MLSPTFPEIRLPHLADTPIPPMLRVRLTHPKGGPIADIAGALFTQHPHGTLVAQPVARSQRVLGVQLRRVVRANGGGDAPLGVSGVAFSRIGLGENDDTADIGQRDRRAQAGDAAADHQKIPADGHGAILSMPR